MAGSFSNVLSLLLSSILFLRPARAVEHWVVTSYFVVDITTSTFTGSFTTETDTITNTWPVKDNFTPTASAALSVSTSYQSYAWSGADDTSFVVIWLPASDVPASELVTTSDHSYGYTSYVQPIVYTPPASCSSRFKVTAWENVDIPTANVHLYPIRTINTTYSVETISPYYTQTSITAFFASQIISHDWADDYTYNNYVKHCANPFNTTSVAYTGDGGYDGGDGSSGGDHSGSQWLCSDSGDYRCWIAGWVIALAIIFPVLFVLGFIENYIWFRRLMLGKRTLRFGTVFWICITLLVLFLTRRCPARSPEDQKELRAQWDKTSAGRRISLWFKYGFRHRYPIELLGEHPLLANQGGPAPSMIPATQQAQREKELEANTISTDNGRNGGSGNGSSDGGAYGSNSTPPPPPLQGGRWVYVTDEAHQTSGGQTYQQGPYEVHNQSSSPPSTYPPPGSQSLVSPLSPPGESISELASPTDTEHITHVHEVHGGEKQGPTGS